jgi:hypothetical protein
VNFPQDCRPVRFVPGTRGSDEHQSAVLSRGDAVIKVKVKIRTKTDFIDSRKTHL